MFKNLRPFLMGFMAAIVFFTGVAATAASVDTDIKAKLMGSIKMKLFSEDFQPKDKNGASIKPISYKGQLYLPVKNLGEGLGVSVEYDKTTKTLWIGGKTEILPVNDNKEYEDYYGTIITTDTQKLTTPTTAYKWGICNNKVLELAYFQCFLKPNGNYKHFTAAIYLDDQVKQDLVMEFRKDTDKGEVIKSLSLKPGETVDVDLDISGIKKVCIISNIQMGHDKVTKLIIGEPAFSNKSE